VCSSSGSLCADDCLESEKDELSARNNAGKTDNIDEVLENDNVLSARDRTEKATSIPEISLLGRSPPSTPAPSGMLIAATLPALCTSVNSIG
jgi:hypothetical protein